MNKILATRYGKYLYVVCSKMLTIKIVKIETNPCKLELIIKIVNSGTEIFQGSINQFNENETNHFKLHAFENLSISIRECIDFNKLYIYYK